MRVYHLAGPQCVEIRDDPLPVPGPRQVLVKSRVSAVSVGTEVWRYVNFGHYGGEGGLCGYNSVGDVVEVGCEVEQLRIGDHVFVGHPHAEYFVADEARAVKLAADADLEASALSYLPTLGLHGLRAAGYQAGDNVLVVGLGIVGLLAAMLAHMVGAQVAALELDPLRRRLAASLGFGPVLDPREEASAGLLDAHFAGVGPDEIIETSQAWSGLLDAVRRARLSTRIAIVGIYRADPPAEVARELLRLTLMNRDVFHNQRLKIIGCSNDPTQSYPAGDVRWTLKRNTAYVAARIHSGDFPARQAITHRFRWDELAEVYRRFVAGDRSMVGVVLHWD